MTTRCPCGKLLDNVRMRASASGDVHNHAPQEKPRERSSARAEQVTSTRVDFPGPDWGPSIPKPSHFDLLASFLPSVGDPAMPNQPFVRCWLRNSRRVPTATPAPMHAFTDFPFTLSGTFSHRIGVSMADSPAEPNSRESEPRHTGVIDHWADSTGGRFNQPERTSGPFRL